LALGCAASSLWSCTILIHGFIKQAALLGAETLGLGGKLQPLEDGVLVGELVDVACLKVSVLNRDYTASRSSSALISGSFSGAITMKRSMQLQHKKCH
jgi:hypothetical protein